jgi:hypothetical protein
VFPTGSGCDGKLASLPFKSSVVVPFPAYASDLPVARVSVVDILPRVHVPTVGEKIRKPVCKPRALDVT